MSARKVDFLIQLGEAACIFLIGLLVIKILLVILRKGLEKSAHVDASLHRFIINAVKILLLVVLIMMTLDKLGVNSSGLVAVIGVAGGAIALALKDSLGNVAGGIMIIFTKPFTRDDYVDIDGTAGSVRHIDLMITTLVTPDNKVVTIPNGRVNTAVITNYSRMETRRVDLLVGIARDADVDRALAVLRKTVGTMPLVKSDPPPFTGVRERTSEAVEIDCFVWADTADYWTVKYSLEEEVKKALEREHIALPRTYVDVAAH